MAEVYKVTLPDRTSFILKVFPRFHDYFREEYFLKRLRGSMLVPKIIAKVQPSESFFGAILMEFLEGELLQRDRWSKDLAFDLGEALARLHSFREKAYGDLTRPETLTPDSSTYFGRKFEEEINECRGHLPQDLVERCQTYFAHYRSLLSSVDGPCIVHRDFRPGNILILQGRLQGIIDWSSACSGFAEQDFCSIEHFQWLAHPEYKKMFLKGYSSLRPIPSYELIMPLLRLGRALAVLGYTFKSRTWEGQNRGLYRLNRQFIDGFDFSSKV